MPPNDVRQEEAKKNGSVSSAVADEVEDGYEYWHLLPWFNSLYERARARDFWNELLERPRLLLGYHLGPEQNHADAALEERIFTIDGHTTPSHHYEPVIHLQSALPDETGSSNFTLSNGDSASTVSSRETRLEIEQDLSTETGTFNGTISSTIGSMLTGTISYISSLWTRESRGSSSREHFSTEQYDIEAQHPTYSSLSWRIRRLWGQNLRLYQQNIPASETSISSSSHTYAEISDYRNYSSPSTNGPLTTPYPTSTYLDNDSTVYERISDISSNPASSSNSRRPHLRIAGGGFCSGTTMNIIAFFVVILLPLIILLVAIIIFSIPHGHINEHVSPPGPYEGSSITGQPTPTSTTLPSSSPGQQSTSISHSVEEGTTRKETSTLSTVSADPSETSSRSPLPTQSTKYSSTPSILRSTSSSVTLNTQSSTTIPIETTSTTIKIKTTTLPSATTTTQPSSISTSPTLSTTETVATSTMYTTISTPPKTEKTPTTTTAIPSATTTTPSSGVSTSPVLSTTTTAATTTAATVTAATPTVYTTTTATPTVYTTTAATTTAATPTVYTTSAATTTAATTTAATTTAATKTAATPTVYTTTAATTTAATTAAATTTAATTSAATTTAATTSAATTTAATTSAATTSAATTTAVTPTAYKTTAATPTVYTTSAATTTAATTSAATPTVYTTTSTPPKTEKTPTTKSTTSIASSESTTPSFLNSTTTNLFTSTVSSTPDHCTVNGNQGKYDANASYFWTIRTPTDRTIRMIANSFDVRDDNVDKLTITTNTMIIESFTGDHNSDLDELNRQLLQLTNSSSTLYILFQSGAGTVPDGCSFSFSIQFV